MLDALIGLQEKASSFFSEYENKYAQQMKCASGCSHCCIGGLSIFTWEAELIIQWFTSLSSEQRSELLNKWEKNQNHDFTDVEGRAARPCSFLVDNQCSIYPRRPIICRTQGMGLKWQEGGKILRDCCPLNFKEIESKNSTEEVTSQEEDELNLDVLNHMMAQAQMIFSKQMNSSIVSQQSTDRIQFEELKQFLKTI